MNLVPLWTIAPQLRHNCATYCAGPAGTARFIAPGRAGADDPPLVLSGVCTSRLEDGRWKKKERGPWAIATPRAKLVEKYTRGTSAIFSHYVYRFPHPDPDRITSVDMEAADRLMGANISAQHERWRGIASPECQEQLAPVLRRIPVRASIEDPTFDAEVGEAIEVLTARDGVQLAIATKLLCIKRPYLIPMMDSVVQDCFGSNRALEILEDFRRLLAEQEVSQRVDALVDQLAAITGVIPSRVRILDELIWFDWNLRPPGADGLCEVVGFPDWVYDPAQDARGVYRRFEA